MRTPVILATLAVAGSSLAAPIGPFDSPVFNSPNPADDARSPLIAPSPLPELASPRLPASPAQRIAGRRRSIPRFKRIFSPNPFAPSAPSDTPQAPSLVMGLGLPSIADAVPVSALSIADSSPLKQVADVVSSPTEEVTGAQLDAMLPKAPNVAAPSMPQTPVNPLMPDTSSLPLPDDELMKLLADKDNVVSAMTQEAMASASEGEPVDPHVLIKRLDQLKAANDRIESMAGLTPDPISLLSKLEPLVESGQLDDVLNNGTPPAPDQVAPPNSPLVYASDIVPTLPVAGPPDSTPADMLDVSAVPPPPPTSPSVVGSSVPIAHDDPTMIPSVVSLPNPLGASTPSLDAPFSLENDSGEPFAAEMLAPSWEWSETTGPVPSPAFLPTPLPIGAREFKPTAPTGKLPNKELPPLLAPPKEKRTSKLKFSAGR